MTITVATANARYDNLDSKDKRYRRFRWNLRKARFGNLLHKLSPDVICFQEFTRGMQNDLEQYLPEYNFFHARARGRAIAWKKGLNATNPRTVNIGNPVAALTVEGYQIVSIHNNAYSAVIRESQENRLQQTFNGPRTIIAGDYAKPDPTLKGFYDSKDRVDATLEDYRTYRPWYSKQKQDGRWVDHIMVSEDVETLSLSLVLTERASDHNIVMGVFE